MGQTVAIATNQIVMMFLLMGVGYLLYRRHFLADAGISQMSDLVLFVANPVLIAMALMRPFDAAVFQGALWVAAVSVTTLLLSIVLGFVAYRDPHDRHAAMGRFSTIFSNTGFIGIPLASLFAHTYGRDGDFATGVVALSTLCSLATMPLMLFVGSVIL